MSIIDLKSVLARCHTPAFLRKEMADEYGSDDLLSTDGLFPPSRVPCMCRAVPWPLQDEELLLLGSVSLPGFCSAHLSGKPEGHPGLPAGGTAKALSHGHPREGLSQHLGPCQRDSRLADLCRLCSGPHQKSAGALRPRALRRRAKSGRLCVGCNRDRPLPVSLPRAKFRRHKGAIKLHTLLDLRGNIPTIVFITPGKVHEVNLLDQIPMEAGAIYILDRAYGDFARLYRIHQSSAFFVTRAKGNFRFERLYSRPVDKSEGVQCDQIIVLHHFYAKKDYPEKLRRIRFYDTEQNRRLVFLTHNFSLPALTIAKIYRCRWQIELFFKWIKQHLRIKTFYGTSENAVKTQIWIAISIYVLVAIVKKQLHLDRSLYTILQILSITLLEKMPILQALSNTDYREEDGQSHNQLNLFD